MVTNITLLFSTEEICHLSRSEFTISSLYLVHYHTIRPQTVASQFVVALIWFMYHPETFLVRRGGSLNRPYLKTSLCSNWSASRTVCQLCGGEEVSRVLNFSLKLSFFFQCSHNCFCRFFVCTNTCDTLNSLKERPSEEATFIPTSRPSLWWAFHPTFECGHLKRL